MEVATEEAATLTKVLPMRMVDKKSFSLPRARLTCPARLEPFFSRYSRVYGLTEINAVSEEEKKALRAKNKRKTPRLIIIGEISKFPVVFKHSQAISQNMVKSLADFLRAEKRGSGQLTDNELTGLFQHLFFSKGQRLILAQEIKCFVNDGNIFELTGFHQIKILFIAVFPISADVHFTVFKKLEEAGDLLL